LFLFQLFLVKRLFINEKNGFAEIKI